MRCHEPIIGDDSVGFGRSAAHRPTFASLA